jgi:hypothetical protein
VEGIVTLLARRRREVGGVPGVARKTDKWWVVDTVAEAWQWS